jgi:hypothetical protein
MNEQLGDGELTIIDTIMSWRRNYGDAPSHVEDAILGSIPADKLRAMLEERLLMGQTQYGPMDGKLLCGRDLQKEALEEYVDALVYTAWGTLL